MQLLRSQSFECKMIFISLPWTLLRVLLFLLRVSSGQNFSEFTPTPIPLHPGPPVIPDIPNFQSLLEAGFNNFGENLDFNPSPTQSPQEWSVPTSSSATPTSTAAAESTAADTARGERGISGTGEIILEPFKVKMIVYNIIPKRILFI